jgi:hypothetical protein
MDTISMFVNVTSIVLAVVSLALSLYFFNVSQKTNKESEKIAGDIKNTTDKLEKLFDKLYSDTFSMLKSQSDAMQNHLFSVGTINNKPVQQQADDELLIIAKIVQYRKITVDGLCKQFANLEQAKIHAIVVALKDRGNVDFDGDLISIKQMETKSDQSES